MITVDIKLPSGIYLDYLGYLFPVDPKTGYYQVSQKSDVGKLCSALANPTPGNQRPDAPQVYGEKKTRHYETVTLKLPCLLSTRNWDNRWMHYSKDDIARITSVLIATFHQDFIAYYLRGQLMGRQKKDIIETFIFSRRLMGPDPFDALHKRAYRLERKRMQVLTEQLTRKARYFDEQLDTKGLI